MIQALLFVKKDDPRTTGIEGMLANLAGLSA